LTATMVDLMYNRKVIIKLAQARSGSTLYSLVLYFSSTRVL
jgi:hypothetical protein